MFISAFNKGGKIIFFGNGGSAADAQHLSAEMVGRFKKDRNALPSIALTVNSSILTALGNDYGFDTVFSRQLQALGKPEDIAVGISTSGESQNVITAITTAKEIGIKTVGFLGRNGGRLKNLVDTAVTVPLQDTARIQEAHILLGHIICEIVEKELFT